MTYNEYVARLYSAWARTIVSSGKAAWNRTAGLRIDKTKTKSKTK